MIRRMSLTVAMFGSQATPAATCSGSSDEESFGERYSNFPSPATYEFIADGITHSNADLDSLEIGKICKGATVEVLETRVVDGQIRGRLVGWVWVTLMNLSTSEATARHVINQGPVHIRKGLLNSYKRRWFVLYNDFTLRYYKDCRIRDETAKPCIINLQHNPSIVISERDPREFTLTTSFNGQETSYCLQAPSERMRTQWMSEISTACESKSGEAETLLQDLYDAGSMVESML